MEIRKSKINYNLRWSAMEQLVQSLNNHARLSRPADSLLTLLGEAKRIEKDDLSKAWEFLKHIFADQATNERAPQLAALSKALLEDMEKIEEHCSLRIVNPLPLRRYKPCMRSLSRGI